MRSFQAPKSFVIKSEKIFDFFQFFFLNVGVDVIEIQRCFVFVVSFYSISISIVAFARAIPPRFLKDNSNSSFAATAKSNE